MLMFNTRGTAERGGWLFRFGMPSALGSTRYLVYNDFWSTRLHIAPGVYITKQHSSRFTTSIMEDHDYEVVRLANDYDDGTLSLSLPQKPNTLSHKLTSILSTSFADADLRDALRILDAKSVRNSPGVRRHLRLDAQREVIDQNAEIITSFGDVADVCPLKRDS